MSVLVDTNILLRLTQPDHPHFILTDKVVDWLEQQGESLFIVPQVIYEFWVVATRPVENNGLGLTVERTANELNRMHMVFGLLPDARDLADIWQRLVIRYRITGRKAHDTRLVASMQFHGITRLLTFNAQDFTVYPDVEILNPAQM